MPSAAIFREDSLQDEQFAPERAAGPAPARPDWAALVAERAYLVRFARRRLLDPTLAEDLVHDVFEAVASGRAAFAGRSTLRSWLTGILKHKIVDLVRQRSGHDSLDLGDGDEDAALELECPQPRPDEVAEQRERLARTLQRMRALPENLRRAVQLRLIDDEESEDVCRELGISAGNLFVRLHRARAVLAA
jgi:RNA polymerase sigma-70 factor (ECF subfamily)